MDRGGLTTNQHEWDRTLTAELVDYSRENEAATLSAVSMSRRETAPGKSPFGGETPRKSKPRTARRAARYEDRALRREPATEFPERVTIPVARFDNFFQAFGRTVLDSSTQPS